MLAHHRDGRAIEVFSWWRHQMEMFSALLALCAGNSPVTGEFPAQRSVTRSFDVFFYLRLNKTLCKQSWSCWFETPSRSLWRHCDVSLILESSVGLWAVIRSGGKRVSRTPGFESWAPSQYPKRRLIVRSREVSKPRDWYLKLSCITLKFDRHIGSNAAEVSVKFLSDRIIPNTNHAASRLHEILR